MEPSHPGLEREANVRLATRLKTAVVLVRRIVRRPCRSELRLFLAPPESFCLSNPFAAIAPVKIRARREAASPSYPRAGPRSGPQSDRLLVNSNMDGVDSGRLDHGRHRDLSRPDGAALGQVAQEIIEGRPRPHARDASPWRRALHRLVAVRRGAPAARPRGRARKPSARRWRLREIPVPPKRRAGPAGRAARRVLSQPSHPLGTRGGRSATWGQSPFPADHRR